jgi:hypothetical protein
MTSKPPSKPGFSIDHYAPSPEELKPAIGFTPEPKLSGGLPLASGRGISERGGIELDPPEFVTHSEAAKLVEDLYGLDESIARREIDILPCDGDIEPKVRWADVLTLEKVKNARKRQCQELKRAVKVSEIGAERAEMEAAVIEAVRQATYETPQPESPRVDSPIKTTAKAEDDCRKYLESEMRASPDQPPMPKKLSSKKPGAEIRPNYLDMCCAKFPGLGWRSFNRAWAKAVEATGVKWGQPGRKKSER